MKSQTIYFAGVRAGGGKTHAMITVALDRLSRSKNSAIVVPTKILMNEIASKIQDRNPNAKLHTFIRGENDDQAVTTRVLDHLKQARRGGEIIILTHECFFKLPFFLRKRDWYVFIDECPKAFVHICENLRENHAIVTEHLALGPASARYSQLSCSNSTALGRIKDNKDQDTVWKSVQHVARHVLDDNYQHYVLSKNYNDLLKGDRTKAQLNIYSTLLPTVLDGFEGVTICAAGFEDTFLFHHWQSLGVDWKRDDAIANIILRPTHPHNPSLEIYYGYERPSTKAIRNKLVNGGDNSLRDTALALMKGEQFVYLENNDFKSKSTLAKSVRGELLPPVSHGVNEYDGYHHAILLPAYNHKPDASKFLQDVCGFDREMQIREMNLGIYQAAMRTSIRLDDVSHTKKWFVFSKHDAELLQARLPGSSILSLGLAEPEEGRRGRQRVHSNDKERRAAHEAKRKELRAQGAGFAGKIAPESFERVVFSESTDEKAIKSKGIYVGTFRGSLFVNWYDQIPKSICMDEDGFIDFLRNHHCRRYIQKDDIPCISGAMFDHSREDEIRKSENVILARGIWIDVEGGDLTPSAFGDVFPRLQFIAYNTFNHTKAAPRFRIYIPTNKAMGFQESVMIHHEVRYTLKHAGYVSGKKVDAKRCGSTNRLYDGIDFRPNPSMLSALPCQTRTSRDSFFIEFLDGRESLNVSEWLKHMGSVEGDDAFYDLPPIPDAGTILTADQEAAVQDALSEWETFGRQKGSGDRGMFLLFSDLRRARLPLVDLEYHLQTAAANSSSPSDRRKQANRLLKRCRK